MKNMMIIETRDPLAVRDFDWSADLLIGMRQTGVPCTLLLTENGVFGARASARVECLSRLLDAGVDVFVDSFALAERGIGDEDLGDRLICGDLGAVIDRLVAGASVLWR
jgi:hypothetical protein